MKDRIEIQNEIENLLDEACDNLSTEDFELLKKRVIEMIENFE